MTCFAAEHLSGGSQAEPNALLVKQVIPWMGPTLANRNTSLSTVSGETLLERDVWGKQDASLGT